MGIDWKELPEITSIGKIPTFGDNYYDGVLEAHNENYFITSCDEVHDLDENGKEMPRSFETIYLVYPMDYIFRHCLELPKFERLPEEVYKYPRSDGYLGADLSGSAYSSFSTDLLLAAREHAKCLKPLGYIRERNLERGE